jgi:hypothetical protein
MSFSKKLCNPKQLNNLFLLVLINFNCLVTSITILSQLNTILPKQDIFKQRSLKLARDMASSKMSDYIRDYIKASAFRMFPTLPKEVSGNIAVYLDIKSAGKIASTKRGDPDVSESLIHFHLN